MEKSARSSIFVAPLHISKEKYHHNSNQNSHLSSATPIGRPGLITAKNQGEMTPPLTPRDPRESMKCEARIWGPEFHNYLRAIYPFHSTCDDSSLTVTLPLDHGDMILVHSVHVNGWADGTLLRSGDRGWLPTNYCEPYEKEQNCFLLRSLTNFYDMVRGRTDGQPKAFNSQDYVQGLVAGVRNLLVKICRHSFDSD